MLGLGFGLAGVAARGGVDPAGIVGFQQALIFAGARQGVWYDPSDLSSLFQDAAGTTPVTAAGQSVGLVLDRSGRGNHATQATAAARPTYGVEPLGGRRNLLTFTEQFDNPAWDRIRSSVSATTEPQQWYFANDGVNATSTLTSAINPSGDAIFAIDIKADTVRYIRLRYGNVTNPNLVNIDAQTGTAGEFGSTNVGDGFFRFYLPFTSGADNNGIIQITLSDTYGGTSVTPSASKRVIIRRPQFELGSTATNYQRVGSAFDVTEAGVPSLHYLSFDGVDDFLVTPTITPGIDKAQVFAGVRKLSDAAQAIIVEHSNLITNSGTLNMNAPAGSGLSFADFAFQSNGTALASATAADGTFNAPFTSVVTGLGDISGDRATLRVNGTQVAQSTADQGTGNFLAYPLYIGRRGGTSLPFNGRIYGLIMRFGANLTADQITQTETWMNSKTGAY